MDVVSKQNMAHGLDALECGRFEDAIGYFSSMLEDLPDNWHCRTNLAVAYLQNGQVLAARTQLIYIAEKCPVVSERQQALSLLKDIFYQETFAMAADEKLPTGWLGAPSA